MKDDYRNEKVKLKSEIAEELIEEGYSDDEILRLIYLSNSMIKEYTGLDNSEDS